MLKNERIENQNIRTNSLFKDTRKKEILRDYQNITVFFFKS